MKDSTLLFLLCIIPAFLLLVEYTNIVNFKTPTTDPFLSEIDGRIFISVLSGLCFLVFGWAGLSHRKHELSLNNGSES